MARQRITSGSRFEDLAAFSRAVVDGDMIYVSGTTGYDNETGEISDDAADQTRKIFEHIEGALSEAQSGLQDILKINVFLRNADDLMPVCEVVREKLDHVRPANTTVVSDLVMPEMKVEIEVTARRGSGD